MSHDRSSDATRIDVHVGDLRQRLLVPATQSGLSIATLLRRAGVPLNTRCGERGLCEGCLLEPVDGKLINTFSGAEVDARHAGTIRACQHRVRPGTPLTIAIPDHSRLGGRASVVCDFAPTLPHEHQPIWRQVEIRPGEWVAEEFFASDWTATTRRDEAIGRPLGLAVDIGTTTVVVMLVDLQSGEVLARAADFNQQMHFGDDVLTRITLCSNPAMLDELRRAVVERTIVPLARRCVGIANAEFTEVVCATVTGNTTMLHLLAGIDPTPLGVMPFTPAFLDHRTLHGDLLAPWGMESGLAPTVHLLPGSSAYVGADLTAGLIATSLIDDIEPSLLVDVGTNGEMIFKHNNRLTGCATAAGPAFEGIGLSCGMRAGDGAVDHVQLSREPFAIDVHVIGDVKPIGFCGSFYIDFLAEGRRIGLIDEHGHYRVEDLPVAARARIAITDCQGHAFRVARAVGGRELVVTEADLASLLTAKASIAAGIETLLSREGSTPANIRNLYLAGGFGTKVSLSNAIAMGLLPGFDIAQVRLVGNASLAGAWLCLLDSGHLARACKSAPLVQVIELNQDADFEDRYINHLRLPTPPGSHLKDTPPSFPV